MSITAANIRKHAWGAHNPLDLYVKVVGLLLLWYLQLDKYAMPYILENWVKKLGRIVQTVKKWSILKCQPVLQQKEWRKQRKRPRWWGKNYFFDFSQDAVLKNLRATTAFFHLSFFRLRIESNRLAPKFLSLLESSSRRKAFRFSKLQRSSNMDQSSNWSYRSFTRLLGGGHCKTKVI